MKIEQTPITGLYLFQPEPIRDNRGFFAEVFTQRELDKIGHTKPIAQVNHAMNVQKGTLRGMHFQHPPKAEIKIVKCAKGEIYDVVVDIRKGSPTFLQTYSITLSADAMTMIYIPEGFAHGYQTLQPNCEVLYFTTEFYSPAHAAGLRFDDPCLNLKWPEEITDISPRDTNHPLITNAFEGISL